MASASPFRNSDDKQSSRLIVEKRILKTGYRVINISNIATMSIVEGGKKKGQKIIAVLGAMICIVIGFKAYPFRTGDRNPLSC